MRILAASIVLVLLLSPMIVPGQTPPQAPVAQRGDTVVLLHGLARSPASMRRMEAALIDAGFATCNLSYPSRHHTVEALARDYVLPAIRACVGAGDAPVHFVTHSMGGIVVRHLAHHGLFGPIGRVVMLSPPNQGSELVDRLGETWLFGLLNGPAGRQLGTDPDSLPLRLGTPSPEVGIITGSRSINPLNSLIIPGDDDGKVAIERAKLDGMQSFLVLKASHTFIVWNRRAIRETVRFLEQGEFSS